ncbi:hypothetical protein H5410_022581 [Solanum commersonii]|uniref:Uncharacterized protein n=1 Tax=Solanum commersonii TaxID=4109 RepID=A0A9J5ZI96_SOLCO|nr:hypothetical protein H5410_022581 [Solanum commersonii]
MNQVLAENNLSITILVNKDLDIITLIGKDLGIITLAGKDLDIITLTVKDLDIINYDMSHHDVHNQCKQAISHHTEETTIHTIQVHIHAFKHLIIQSTRVTTIKAFHIIPLLPTHKQ